MQCRSIQQLGRLCLHVKADLGPVERNVMIAVRHKYRVHSEDLTMGPKKMMVQKKCSLATMGSFKCPMLVLGGNIVNIENLKHTYAFHLPSQPPQDLATMSIFLFQFLQPTPPLTLEDVAFGERNLRFQQTASWRRLMVVENTFCFAGFRRHMSHGGKKNMKYGLQNPYSGLL